VLASGVALVGFAGLAFAQVPVAMADPTEVLVAMGSDTVQDVYNQFAIDDGGNTLGSYDAVNPVTQAANEIVTPVDGTSGTRCSFQRPNGSGGGIAALRASINQASTLAGLSGTAMPQAGCVDIARSSSGVANADPAGGLVWIPFATDAVAGATGAPTGTTLPAPYSYTYAEASAPTTQNTVTATPVITAINQADAFTMVDLTNLYKNCATITEGGVSYWPFQSGVTQPPGTQQIDLYLPQPNSGTAKFWAGQFGISASAPPACVHQVIVGGPLATATGGVPVEEHNGTPMVTDADGFGPFSAAQWIAQRNGHNDRRHSAVLHLLGPCTGITNTNPATGTCTAAVSPTTGASVGLGNLNVNFPITRSVFSVASFARVTNSADPLFSLLNASSAADFLCNEQGAILGFGFALNPSCGQVLTANRGDITTGGP
jgi:hypothetical protein